MHTVADKRTNRHTNTFGKPSLVQIMAWRLDGAKPLSEPLLEYCCWTLGNKLQWNFNRNWNIFFQENAFENVVCRMASICLGLNVLKIPISVTEDFFFKFIEIIIIVAVPGHIFCPQTPYKSFYLKLGVSNHQPHDCLLNRLFRHRSKKTSKLRVTGLCEGILR